MSDQTAANKPTQPVLCKNGCGFFGNTATGGMCSKCHREFQKKEEPTSVSSSKELISTVEKVPAPMQVDPKPEAEEIVKSKPLETPKKRKKKKTSYKNMMAGMMKSNTPSRDIEQEKEGLRKVTGGGAFTKIDKI